MLKIIRNRLFKPLNMKQALSFKDHKKGVCLLLMSPSKDPSLLGKLRTANIAETHRVTLTLADTVYFARREKGGKGGGVENGIRDQTISHFLSLSPKLQRQ